MKTTYRRGNIEVRQRTLILAGVILVLLFILMVPPVRSVVSRGIYAVAPGMWDTRTALGSTWSFFRERMHTQNTLATENKDLKDRLERMEVQVLDRNLLAEKVAVLEESLGRTPVDNRITAYVLAGPGRSPYDTLALDVGSDDGVMVGQYVTYVGAGLIGKIVEVYPSSSKAQLFSSYGGEVSVLIGKDAIPVTAEGRGMGNFKAIVPASSLVLEGDEVRVAPGDLILGNVVLVETKPSEPMMYVYFRTTFNIAEIQSVEIIERSK